jgi:hypothetical protein
MEEKLSVLYDPQLYLNHVIFCFPALNFVKICLPKSKWYHPRSKVKVNVFNLSDELKIWYLLKGGMSLAAVGLC